MVESIILVGAAAAAVAGFAWLALAMQGHWQQVHGSPGQSQAARMTLRVLGACGLVSSGALCFAVDRPSMAILLWIMLMTLAAVSITLILAWKPVLLRFAFPVLNSRIQVNEYKA